MKINRNIIQKIGILYLAIPTVIFLFSWLKLPLAIISSCVLTFSIYYVFHNYLNNVKTSDSYININKTIIVIVIVVFVIWCIMSGIGGYFYQSTDFSIRNLILNDLVTREWPVVYEEGFFLTYYIGFWLVPALFGKCLLILGFSTNISLLLANFILWFWTLIGIVISYLLVVAYLKKNRKKDQVIILIIFLFFSGLDVIGLVFRNLDFSMHIEWWAQYYQFSSNTTQLFWVFNQAVPAWIGTMLLIIGSDLRKDILIGILLMIFSPLPLIGCFVICVGKTISIFMSKYKKDVIGLCKELFTIPNLLSLAFILPFLFLYLFSSPRALNVGAVESSGFNISIGGLNLYRIIVLLAFMFLEFGIYLIFIYKENKNNYLFYVCLLCMPLFCTFRYGVTADFQMRGSIPLLIILMVMIMNFSCENLEFNGKKWTLNSKIFLLVFVLTIASITPITEMYRGYYHVRRERKVVVAEESPAFTEKSLNFVSLDYENSLFHKLVGK